MKTLQKLAAFLIIFRDLDILLKLIQKWNFSPFRNSIDKINYIHLCTMRGHKYVGVLLKLLSIDWTLKNTKSKKINIQEILKIKTGDTLETPLHLACKFDNISAFRYMKLKGGSLDDISLRGWKPLDQAPRFSRSFYYARREYQKQNMKEYLSLGNSSDSFNSLKISSKKLRAYDIPYQYCIITKSDSPNSFDTMMCNLLLNIQATHGSGFKFKIIEGFANYNPPSEEHLRGLDPDNFDEMSESHVQNKKRYDGKGQSLYNQSNRDIQPLINSESQKKRILKQSQQFNGQEKSFKKSNVQVSFKDDEIDSKKSQIKEETPEPDASKSEEPKKGKNRNVEDNYYIFLITLEEELCRKIAKKLNEPMYNSYLHYHTYYNEDLIDNYEPFRDTQIQGFLMKLFNEEFDIHQLTTEGYIIDHFPTHHFSERYSLCSFKFFIFTSLI